MSTPPTAPEVKPAPATRSPLSLIFLFVVLILVGGLAVFGRPWFVDYFRGVEMEAAKGSFVIEVDTNSEEYKKSQASGQYANYGGGGMTSVPTGDKAAARRPGGRPKTADAPAAP